MYVSPPYFSYASWQTAPTPEMADEDKCDDRRRKERTPDLEGSRRLEAVHLQIHVMIPRQRLGIDQRRDDMQRLGKSLTLACLL